MATYNLDNCTAASINAGLQAQASQYRAEVMPELAQSKPYSNLFEGGTQEAHIGESILTVVPGRTVLNQSMTAPETIRLLTACGYQGPTAEQGSSTYTARMETIRGRGPDLCIHGGFTSVEGLLPAHERELKRGIMELMEADARKQLFGLSGYKFIAKGGPTYRAWNTKLAGGDRVVSQAWPAIGIPDSQMPFKAVKRLADQMAEEATVEKFGDGDGYAIWIAGSQQIEYMRNQADLKNETVALVQGSDSATVTAFKKYQFTRLYRGISTAVDPRPLRFNSVDGSNVPILIEPYKRTTADNGTEWRINPDWQTAGREIGFLVFRNTLRRLVPARYTKDGAATWPAQFAMGEIEWFNKASMGCNEREETGHFNYDIPRAWQPHMPWGIAAVAYERCEPDDGFAQCTGASE